MQKLKEGGMGLINEPSWAPFSSLMSRMATFHPFSTSLVARAFPKPDCDKLGCVILLCLPRHVVYGEPTAAPVTKATFAWTILNIAFDRSNNWICRMVRKDQTRIQSKEPEALYTLRLHPTRPPTHSYPPYKQYYLCNLSSAVT